MLHPEQVGVSDSFADIALTRPCDLISFRRLPFDPWQDTRQQFFRACGKIFEVDSPSVLRELFDRRAGGSIGFLKNLLDLRAAQTPVFAASGFLPAKSTVYLIDRFGVKWVIEFSEIGTPQDYFDRKSSEWQREMA